MTSTDKTAGLYGTLMRAGNFVSLKGLVSLEPLANLLNKIQLDYGNPRFDLASVIGSADFAASLPNKYHGAEKGNLNFRAMIRHSFDARDKVAAAKFFSDSEKAAINIEIDKIIEAVRRKVYA